MPRSPKVRDPDATKPLRKWVDGPVWIMGGCEACHGDLFESSVERSVQFFECLLCGREHERKAGTKNRPHLLTFG